MRVLVKIICIPLFVIAVMCAPYALANSKTLDIATGLSLIMISGIAALLIVVAWLYLKETYREPYDPNDNGPFLF